MAACYAVENSLGYQADPSARARLIRNIVLGFEFVMSHILHFYALAALDYVQGPGNPFGGTTLAGLPAQSGPWTPDYNINYYGHPVLTRADVAGVWDEIILDYVLAIQMQRKAAEVQGVFGARWPMFSNLVCGGVTHPYLEGQTFTDAIGLAREVLYKGKNGAPDFEGGTQTGTGTALAPDQGTLMHFIKKHYIPDVQTVAAIYSDYDNNLNTGVSGLGKNMGQGCGNFVSYGVFHETDPLNKAQHPNHLLKTGVVAGGAWAWNEAVSGTADPINMLKTHLKEYIDHSWYDDDGDYAAGLAPDKGYTKPNRDKAGAYSWIKAPRIVGGSAGVPAGTYAAEVGPLARMINSDLYNVGIPGQVGPVNVGVAPFGLCANRPKIAAVVVPLLWGPCSNPQNFGVSTMDRHRARVLEALTVANALSGGGGPFGYAGPGWIADLAALGAGSSVDKTWAPNPTGTFEGWGTNEAPRGALLHYNKYSENRIATYQCVVPTTWNCSPEGGGKKGPVEQACMNPQLALSGYKSASGRTGGSSQYVAVEALRVVHSFDPCIACAVHKIDGKKVKEKRLDIKKEVSRQ